MQTGDLLIPPKGPFAVFEAMVNQAVFRYLQHLPQDPQHPYLARQPRSWRLDVWGVVLTSSGYQAAHMHPGGWVSGVYYVALPDVVDKNSAHGWIEFGRPPSALGTVPETDIIRIIPQPGKLVLFPSYLFHQTVPFDSPQRRISVAFDAIPVGW